MERQAVRPQAELWKAAAAPQHVAPQKERRPECDYDLVVGDATIIAQGSDIEGLFFSAWDERDEDIAKNFGLGLKNNDGFYFEDADGLLELSDRQREVLHEWRRFSDIVSSGKDTPKPAVLDSLPASDTIRQGLVGDCSFLSALSALAEFERKFREPVLSSIIYPQLDRGDVPGPVYNEYGQYGCRLFINGTVRKVVVDDRVPVRHNGQLLCGHSSVTHEFWVTVLEKSFAKLMGSSYDMQGSNPGTDVFHLAGWVPETITLGGDRVQTTSGDVANSIEGRNADAWDEVFNMAAEGYRCGRCIICVGTTRLEDAVPNELARRLGHVEGVSTSTGLVANHAYPVLDCRRIGRHRLLRMKNPWGRVRWCGRYSPGDAQSWEEVARTAAELNSPGPCTDPLSPRSKLAASLGQDPTVQSKDDGHFWIEWADVVHYFSHLYLCWAPSSLGAQRLEVHGSWDPEPHFAKSSLPDDTHIIAFNPQFLLRLDGPLPEGHGPMSFWALLSRHVRIRKDIASYYVAPHFYRGNSRLSCPDAPQEMGVYSNGECALVRLLQDVGETQNEFVLVVSQHGHKVSFNFTLQVYMPVSATLTPLPPIVPDHFVSGTVDGKWRPETAGGCSNDIWGFFTNPHWLVEVPAGGARDLVVFLECPSEYSVNVRFFCGAAAIPEHLRRSESSGPYRQGCCMLRLADLSEGPHVLLVSTFRPGLHGDYRIAWHASKAIVVRPLPHAFVAPLPPPLRSASWGVTAGARTRLPVHVEQRTLVSLRLQCDFKDGLPPLLKLLHAAPGREGSDCGGVVLEQVECVVQKDAFSESYFAFSGATVILAAELVPGYNYVVEALASLGGSGHVVVFINSDWPVLLSEPEVVD